MVVFPSRLWHGFARKKDLACCRAMVLLDAGDTYEKNCEEYMQIPSTDAPIKCPDPPLAAAPAPA